MREARRVALDVVLGSKAGWRVIPSERDAEAATKTIEADRRAAKLEVLREYQRRDRETLEGSVVILEQMIAELESGKM